MKTPTQTCTDHCRLCGQHFHGLTAYDLHRVGDVALRDGSNRRRCGNLAEVCDRHGRPALQVWTTTGVCTLGLAPREEGVTIWRVVPSPQQLAFYAKGRSEQNSQPRTPETGAVGAGHAAPVFHSATVIPSSEVRRS